jgi:CHAD domain-containing protein/CYTH domain-containing protein
LLSSVLPFAAETMPLPASFLERPPEEAARLLCLGLLHEADHALRRLERNEDPEALHDFRVALRRLRSLTSAYRPYLKGSMKKKLRARLKELASSTNASRDAEVQLDWLEKNSPGLEPPARASADRLRERLEREIAHAPGPEAVRSSFHSLDTALEKSLARVRLRLDRDRETFLSTTGKLLEVQAAALKESLSAVTSAEDGEKLHRARIEAKRLRYLLEPLQAGVHGVRNLVKRMKSLQDQLGELQDTRVLTTAISKELETSAIETAHRLRDLALQHGEDSDRERVDAADPGLLALLKAQRERRDRSYAGLAPAWLSEAASPFLQDVADLAERLAGEEGRPAGKRRFLLKSVPEKARGAAPRLIRSGFLPGRRVRERIQAVHTGRRVRYSRAVAVEGAPSIEETLSRSAFERLWPLTVEKRLERLRYSLREGDRLWRVDTVAGRNLILAEAELDSGAELPSWLAPLVIREVTGMKKYEPEALAKGAIRNETRSAPERRVDPPAEAP